MVGIADPLQTRRRKPKKKNKPLKNPSSRKSIKLLKADFSVWFT